jgi:hypothetical protein
MNLHKSPHGVWYYRRPIIIEDQLFWRGPTGKPKKEWNLSLRTKDRRIAIDERYPAAHRAYQAERDKQLAAIPSRQDCCEAEIRAGRLELGVAARDVGDGALDAFEVEALAMLVVGQQEPSRP